MSRNFEHFDFCSGRALGGRYVLEERIGAGWEGEVYHIVERGTGISRVAKFYYPDRNGKGSAARKYAMKLHRLRDCPVVIPYLYHDRISFRGYTIEYVVADLAPGEILSAFQCHQPGKRFASFEALHLLHAIATGIEPIHDMGEYHGDLHDDNILVERRGLGFRIKTVDFFDLGRPSREKILQDVVDIVHLFHGILGGARYYGKQPPLVKEICRGLKGTLIRDRFRSAGDLRFYLETYDWEA
ncbi:MAG: serine/threonine protein kinase [Candidatus Eisenbacteria bacterium]|nr:serine/threonine protein kinase [Candidatus Eisenbacteria bacterium]